MDWQTIRQQFEEIREDHGGASVDARCFVVGDGLCGWVAIWNLSPHIHNGGEPTACRRLWPEPVKLKPEESVYGKERKEGEPPEPPKPVVLMGPYRAIELGGASDEAISQFVKAAHEAGARLPKEEHDAARIPPEAAPAIRWIFWLLHVLRDHPRKFVEITGDPTAKENPQLVHKVNKAISASLTAIDEAGLLKPNTSRGTAKITREEANIKAREYLAANPLATARELAEAIGCSLGLVSKLTAWRAVAGERKRGAKPKAVAFTSNLEQLIADQRADDEGSPLGVCDESGCFDSAIGPASGSGVAGVFDCRGR